jgi:hypothetical protein
MRSRKLMVVGLSFLAAFLFWSWRTHLPPTYAKETSRFEAEVRRTVNPAQLQGWATMLLRQYSITNAADDSYALDSFPASLNSASKRRHYGFVFPNQPDGQSYIRLVWGGGHLGYWGLHIGSTNFTDPTGKMWSPGVYFWTEH